MLRHTLINIFNSNHHENARSFNQIYFPLQNSLFWCANVIRRWSLTWWRRWLQLFKNKQRPVIETCQFMKQESRLVLSRRWGVKRKMQQQHNKQWWKYWKPNNSPSCCLDSFSFNIAFFLLKGRFWWFSSLELHSNDNTTTNDMQMMCIK